MMLPKEFFRNQEQSNSPPLRFPQKLWKIANECQSEAVSWSPDGKSILLRYTLFREEFMSTKNDFFKTDNIASFVRQLNLYGFRKVYEHAHKQAYKANTDLHEFSNGYFRRDRPDLLDKVTRKSVALKDKNEFWPDNLKSSDFSETTSDAIWGKLNVLTENSDHSYLCSRENENLNLNDIEKRIIETVDEIYIGENPILCTSETSLRNTVTTEPIPSFPIKKKRGRKPGSKYNSYKTSGKIPKYRKLKKSKLKRTIHYCPTLKNPEYCPNLIFYNDDAAGVFLKNTSRDIMLSSTMTFQESTEYLELKEAYCGINDSKILISTNVF